jgi:hypothetical protein
LIGLHGHHDAAGKLNLRSVNEQGLDRWIIKHSDGKADEALVKRWINIEKNAGAANFLHPEVAASHQANVFSALAMKATDHWAVSRCPRTRWIAV